MFSTEARDHVYADWLNTLDLHPATYAVQTKDQRPPKKIMSGKCDGEGDSAPRHEVEKNGSEDGGEDDSDYEDGGADSDTGTSDK